MDKKVVYIIMGKRKVAIVKVDIPIPENELYDRIFLPGKAAIENSLLMEKEEVANE